ncbi:WD40 repeat-like protein [Rhizopus microsporus ATCC 52813]|uniref:Ribosome biogenesis protein YTM1 n=1 Tax=Rhizopus microsporus ATCC 52813 TaxID=1340429 RepID=A0A2G4T705_RHIZD|nr:WD40 repeat-like protein [Rhizopus microsporus ATCC 52813]PHZ16805.1 WD40 repeat-like protein [Rhizopus microsporus ATCC 52813]
MSEQVQVRFVTESQYKVSDAAMLLPSDIKKEGLSEIVNGLLDNETPVPFDFLIDGQLLRTSIAEYLNMNRLSTENLITIEYVESMLPPVPLTAYQHDDWISSVTGNRGLFVTGSYDNMVRLWNTTGECISTLVGHTDSVKSVALGRVDDNKAIVFSGSLDHSVLAWEYSFDDESYRLMYECKGHKGPVESVATDSNGNYIASAAADGIVRVWTSSEPTEDESLEEEPKKKKKKTVNSRKIKTKSLELEGHVGAVNAVTFNTVNSNIVYTGGWDHSIRSWDVEQQVNLVTKNCEKVVLGVDYSSRAQLLATGHADNTIRLWDLKSDDGTNVKLALRGHSAWVSSVSWSKTSEHMLCSGSYDSTVRVWDIRSSKEPLYTMDSAENKEKVLSVYWDNEKILSGGEEKKLRIYQAKV